MDHQDGVELLTVLSSTRYRACQRHGQSIVGHDCVTVGQTCATRRMGAYQEIKVILFCSLILVSFVYCLFKWIN